MYCDILSYNANYTIEEKSINTYEFDMNINRSRAISYNNSFQSKHLQTKPSRGFGSNQVDFGGMIKPASAISVSSYSWTGYIAKAATQSSLHLFTSSPSPRMPPTKSIRSSPLKSWMPRIGFRTRSVSSWQSSILVKSLASTFSVRTLRRYQRLLMYKELSPFYEGIGSP